MTPFISRTNVTFWSVCLIVLSLSAPSTSYAFSLSDLFGGNEAESTVKNPLTEMLSSQLDISPEQAAGGAGALLSIASSQLDGEQASELAKMIPGAEALTGSLPPGIGALLGNMDTIHQIFAALGLDSKMVSQFIPVVMQFLGDKGASAGLLENLSKVWSMPAPDKQ
ncbi:DUF2780 domain-containing protein [Photobacterium nomapromontoriensis]|uniref:DUF2780 domain-containing protein n=1 Tax=Photobacterium nomapromontoriensis TaxID=2910237 RepID=UPI003D0F9FBE